MDFKNLNFKEYKYRFIFSLVFLTIGILILLIGFWKTLFLLLCVLIGYLIGLIIDKNLFIDFIERLKDIFFVGRE
ncbi:MAG: DUF2273 domain-containing protein [Dictyoglomus thermophilum]|uniref:DUF2273 domain-containing protein n=1 Tax=Dictyoglomus thermophilum TaxID=14 RepID=A0A7C3KNY3_DICTH|nr:DUF2273 domain-containing protein [Dictyoglomus thermophilum]MCX7720912.1 DUF2273 domain-containing protein [Dictyoglomus thermophilum]TYT22378.1 DUF2273 domain-containing protein [Dictyoglomus thermophilum]